MQTATTARRKKSGRGTATAGGSKAEQDVVKRAVEGSAAKASGALAPAPSNASPSVAPLARAENRVGGNAEQPSRDGSDRHSEVHMDLGHTGG